MNLQSRSRFSLLIVWLFIILASYIFPQSYEVLTIQGDGINIRQEANVNSRVVLKLNNTDRCDVLSVGNKEALSGKEDYWYQVKYQSKTGWVFGAYTSLKQEGRKTIKATFQDCDAGDMEHIIFIDDKNNKLDFGGAPNNLGNYKLCIVPENDWIPTGNPKYIGKKFDLTYSIIKCLLKGYEGNPDGVIMDWPTIIEIKETLVDSVVNSNNYDDTDLMGTWVAIEMEGKEVNEGSEDQFILIFLSNHNLHATRLKRGQKRETWGTWQLIQEEQGSKLYFFYNEENIQKKETYSIELKGDLLTFINPKKLDRPYRSIWKKSNN